MSEATPGHMKRRRRRPVGYSPTKAAHLSAYLLIKGGAEISKLKLVKLLYLAERKCAEIYGSVMFFDRYFALEHGPIPTMCLNGLDGEADQEVWSPLVELDGNVVKVRPGVVVPELDHLSDADREIADALLVTFGGRDGMTASQVREWTHEHLPEYRAKEAALARGSLAPEIRPIDMARGLGLPAPREFAEADAEMRSIAES